MPASEPGRRERALAQGQTAEPSWIGRCFEGRYQIEAQLGSGGVGRVYRARHLALDRAVALKVLRKQHNERWVSRQRFEREARALAQLSHSNIVAVTDSGIEGDVPFLVMELLEGQDLDACLRAGALSPAAARGYALQLLEGLAFVHERGLMHRDIKPGNVFLERSDRVKLLDFGLAKLVVVSTDAAAVTRHGEVLGTPAYMAPEQVTGEVSDARTDVYAVGLILFEMIAGRRPFCGSDSEVLRQQLVEPVPLLADLVPRVPGSATLDAIVQRATEKEQSQRFPDARAMATALAAVTAELSGAIPQRSASAVRRQQPAAKGASRRSRPSRVNALLRVSALLVSCLAFVAIVVACGVIYLLAGPEAAERRELFRAVVSSVLGEPGARR